MIRQILKKYLLGSAGEEETATVDRWYQSLDNSLVAMEPEEKAAVKEEIWNSIMPAIEEPKLRHMPRYWKVASWAAVFAGAMITLFLVYNRSSRTGHQLAFTTIETKDGQMDTVTLEDGTVLTLNAGTLLHVYNDFSSTRRVDLVDGEVFFDVRQQKQQPFLIESNGLSIAVLGTSFNVSAYSGLENIQVGVVTGKVRVSKAAATLGVLEQHQGLVYNKARAAYQLVVNDAAMLAWKEGRLVMNDVSFEEMAFLIKKNFGIDVVTNDNNIRTTKYTTELFTSMTPQQAVEVLAAIHHLKIKRTNNRIFFYQ